MARYLQPSHRVELSTFLLCVTLSLLMLFLPDDVQISVATRLSAVFTEPYQRVINFAEDVFRVRRENGRLLAKITELELQLAEMERQRDSRRSTAKATATAGGFDERLQPCEVVARKCGRYALMIKIRSETDFEWQLYQPVVSPRGLLGRVRKVASPRMAWVELLTAPDVAIGCEMERTGLVGILRSNAGKFVLDMVGRDEDVQEGDRIITSGLAEVSEIGQEEGGFCSMPHGLQVGEVRSVASPLDELYKKITVEPYASFNVNEWVFVVKSGYASAPKGGSRP